MPKRPQVPKRAERKKLHVKTGDMVMILSGDGRSKTPRKVLSTLASEGKVVVEGVNVMKKAQKQNQQQGGRQAGINEENFIETAMPIHASKVALIDPKSGERTRVRFQIDKDGKKQRVAVKSGQTV